MYKLWLWNKRSDILHTSLEPSVAHGTHSYSRRLPALGRFLPGN